MTMFEFFIICVTCRFGLVDRVEGDFVMLEVRTKDDIIHIDLPIKDAPCLPTEGQLILFDALRIIRCLEIKK